MRTPLEIILMVAALCGVYIFVAALICCEFTDDKKHWWCPSCLMFGKRRNS